MFWESITLGALIYIAMMMHSEPEKQQNVDAVMQPLPSGDRALEGVTLHKSTASDFWTMSNALAQANNTAHKVPPPHNSPKDGYYLGDYSKYEPFNTEP